MLVLNLVSVKEKRHVYFESLLRSFGTNGQLVYDVCAGRCNYLVCRQCSPGCVYAPPTHSLLHVGNEVVPVLGLLQTSESHLGSRDVLLRVLEVLEQGLLVLA